MLYRIFFLLATIPLFAATSSSVIALGTQSPIVFPIDAMQRGTELVNTFSSLSHASATTVPEIAFQTTLPNLTAYTTYRYIFQGFIPYVQKITQTKNNTLLILTYLTPQLFNPQYIVLPVEQVVDLLYFFNQYNAPSANSTPQFTSTYAAGTLPYYSVDPIERAQDIASAVATLLAKPFKTSPLTQVWIQTTLGGPYYPPIYNGLIQNVTSVSANNTILQIEYLPQQGYPQTTQTLYVAPEQVQQIIYINNFNSP